jgi:uncharacterized protein YjiS (DUF1127 family)
MKLSHVLWLEVSFAATPKSSHDRANHRIQEGEMSLCLSENVTNNHDSGVLARINHQFHVWANRWQQRHELTHWSDRDLHDVGLSWSEVVREAEKPFWRA